jgi:hypothetical protein
MDWPTMCLGTDQRSSDIGLSRHRKSIWTRPPCLPTFRIGFGSRFVSGDELDVARANGEIMSAIPTNVGVFFGQLDKRATGWYWVDARSEKLRGAIRGPFETKERAVEDALQGPRDAQDDEPQDEPQLRGAA